MPSTRRKYGATDANALTSKPLPTPPAPRRRRRQQQHHQQQHKVQPRRARLCPSASDDHTSDEYEAEQQSVRRVAPLLDADTDGTTDEGPLGAVGVGGGRGGDGTRFTQEPSRRVSELAVGISGSLGGDVRQSLAMSAAGTADAWIGGGGGVDGDGGSAMMSGGDEEGLRLLRQQLSAVQRIRIEHERKDATIAALRLEVSTLGRQRDEMLASHRERSGDWARLVKMEERCRRLEEAEREASRRWTSEEEAWKKQIAEAQEQLRAERERAKFRAGTLAERLTSELEGERTKARGFEEKLRVMEQDLAAANDKSGRLIPRLKTLEETNEALRAELTVASGRCLEAELEAARLNAYRPLVEQADSIDRRRGEAEDSLRVAAAELDLEREALAAAREEAAELRLALDKRGSRLTEVEAEAKKSLSLEHDLLLVTSRLNDANAARDAAVRSLRDAEDRRHASAAALDELAELALEALPSLSLLLLPPDPAAAATATSTTVTTVTTASTAGAGAGGGGGGLTATSQGVCFLEDGDGGGNEGAAIARRLAGLEAKLREREGPGSYEMGVQTKADTVSGGRDSDGGGGGRTEGREGRETRCDAGNRWRLEGGGEGGQGELRRAVRAVRALVEAGARTAADRDRAVSKLSNTRAELRSALDRLEASQREVARVGKALEETCASRSGLLPRLREMQASKESAEVVAHRTSSELADIRSLLSELVGDINRSTDVFGGGGSPGWSSTSGDELSPDAGATGDRSGSGSSSSRSSSSARLISAVSAGVKGLLAERTAAANALRELDDRYSQGRREIEKVTAGAREQDAAHREQLVELRTWCESEVEAQRRAKKAAQTAADCALRDLSVANKKISAFEKDKSRIHTRVAAANDRLSSLADEAWAAKNGLRLLARACAPLVERCRVLAAQKRLLTKWYGPAIASEGREAAAAAAAVAGCEGVGGGKERRRKSTAASGHRSSEGGAAEGVTARPGKTVAVLVDELRSLVAALGSDSGESPSQGRQDGREDEERRQGNWIGSNDGQRGSGEWAMHGAPLGWTGGGDGTDGNTAEKRELFQQQHHQQQEHRPLASFRAVGIAAVAAQRFSRLAACRAAARREFARAADVRAAAAASAAAAAADAAVDEATKKLSAAASAAAKTTVSPGILHGCSPSSPLSPTEHFQDVLGSNTNVDDGDGGNVILLGPRGSGGVPMLNETEIVSPRSLSAALSSLYDGRSRSDATILRGGGATAAAAPGKSSGGDSVGGGGGGGGDHDSPAAQFLWLLSAVVLRNTSWGGERRATGERGGRGMAMVCGGIGDAPSPSLLQVIAGGQVGHWWRLEKRGLVQPPPSLPWGGGGGGGGGASRVIASRCSRHFGRDFLKARQDFALAEEAQRLLGATRRGMAALARLAGEAETRLLESEALRLRANDEVDALEASKKALGAALKQKSELVSFLEERVQMMEGEASGTVPAAALAGTEKALTESLAEVETLRVRSASLHAELMEVSERRRREARKARKGAQVATQEKAARAQLQNELLSLRSYVLRSEQTVQELQEEARRQMREAGSTTTTNRCIVNGGGGGGGVRSIHRCEPGRADSADDAKRCFGAAWD